MPTKLTKKDKQDNKTKIIVNEELNETKAPSNKETGAMDSSVLDITPPPSKKQKKEDEENIEKQASKALVSIKKQHTSKIDTSNLDFMGQKCAALPTVEEQAKNIIEPNAMYILMKCAIQVLEKIVEVEHQQGIDDSLNSGDLAFLQTEMDEERYKSGILNIKIAEILIKQNITDPKKVISLNCKFLYLP